MKDAVVEHISAKAYRISTDGPESDGTLSWHQTTVIIVHVRVGGFVGMGWTYASAAAVELIHGVLAPVIVNRSIMSIESCWQAMNDALRNDNHGGLCAMAVSAVDVALWDAKARYLGIPLIDLIGSVRETVPVYGSGGFTNYDDTTLSRQLKDWVAGGIRNVKMKVGRDAADDLRRVQVARRAIGDKVGLFVDANGAYSRKQALQLATRFAGDFDVCWFEEPVSSDDLEGLHLLRARIPAGMEVAAGEYGDTPTYFRHMLEAQAIDCLQADATRCGGITGFLKVATLAEAFHIPLSAHCAPQLHAHISCCVRPLRHIEYFHDHVRCDRLLFDGILEPVHGELSPDRSRLGHGLCLKHGDAEQHRV